MAEPHSRIQSRGRSQDKSVRARNRIQEPCCQCQASYRRSLGDGNMGKLSDRGMKLGIPIFKRKFWACSPPFPVRMNLQLLLGFSSLLLSCVQCIRRHLGNGSFQGAINTQREARRQLQRLAKFCRLLSFLEVQSTFHIKLESELLLRHIW